MKINLIQKKWLLLILIPMLSGCGIFSRGYGSSGSYTGANAGKMSEMILIGSLGTTSESAAVYSYSFNTANSTAEHTGTFYTPAPSFFALNDNRNILYIANEIQEKATVTAAKLNRNSGELELINQSYTVGKGPAYISVLGDKVVTANYGDGSITLMHTQRDGSLGQADWRIELGTAGVSHPHATYFTPSGSDLYVPDLGLDRIFHFSVHNTTPPLTIDEEQIKLPEGSGPRHIVFDQQSRYAYLVTERAPMVYVYKNNGGSLEPIQEISTGRPASGAGAHVALSPDGKYLYTSHRIVGDGITIFSVNRVDGTLQLVGFQPTGKHPRHFAISPDGSFLAVAARDSGQVEIYWRDRQSGKLAKNPTIVAVAKPVFILWSDSRR